MDARGVLVAQYGAGPEPWLNSPLWIFSFSSKVLQAPASIPVGLFDALLPGRGSSRSKYVRASRLLDRCLAWQSLAALPMALQMEPGLACHAG